VSLLEDGRLTAVYHELDIISRQNEVDESERVRKQKKRHEAAQRREERESEADAEAFRSTPNLGETVSHYPACDRS
jgi:hypothetical protein